MDADRKFEREKSLVESLMRRCAVPVEGYIDPNQEAQDETGADVIAIVDGRRIGIQVTELDTGEMPGQARRTERASWREAQAKDQGTYGGWAQNDPRKIADAIARTLASKVQHIVGCDEAWLLISASLPELGSLISTFVITQWLTVDALDAATASHLAKCKYTCAFLHVIVSPENALYCWTAERNWRKLTLQDDENNQGQGFFEWRDRLSEFQEWMTDTEGKTDREVEKCLREFRMQRGQGKPLPSFMELSGEWIVEGFIFLYHSDSERAPAATFTRHAERHDGQLCIGFDSSQLAAALGVDVETVVRANQNQTLVVCGTAAVPPTHGGVSATAYGFRIATHVHLHLNATKKDRLREEQDLLANYTDALAPGGCNVSLHGLRLSAPIPRARCNYRADARSTPSWSCATRTACRISTACASAANSIGRRISSPST